MEFSNIFRLTGNAPDVWRGASMYASIDAPFTDGNIPQSLALYKQSFATLLSRIGQDTTCWISYAQSLFDFIENQEAVTGVEPLFFSALQAVAQTNQPNTQNVLERGQDLWRRFSARTESLVDKTYIPIYDLSLNRMWLFNPRALDRFRNQIPPVGDALTNFGIDHSVGSLSNPFVPTKSNIKRPSRIQIARSYKTSRLYSRSTVKPQFGFADVTDTELDSWWDTIECVQSITEVVGALGGGEVLGPVDLIIIAHALDTGIPACINVFQDNPPATVEVSPVDVPPNACFIDDEGTPAYESGPIVDPD